LAATSREIARGNYEVDLPVPRGEDEVANLINTFRSMLTEVKGYRENLESRIEEAREKIKATEEQLIIAQRLSATGTLAAGIAHEINNPLGGIINAAERLKKPNLEPAKTKEYLDLIIEGLERIQEILKKILQFFPRKLTAQPLDLKPVIDRALLLIQHRLESNKITVIQSVSSNLPQVYGEANELQQVFLNLLMNATDAVMARRTQKPDEEGRGTIQISDEFDQHKVSILFKDDGVGMSEAEINRAFDLFYTTKEPGKGTGLGLPVAYNIIQNHNGKLTLHGKKGQGVTAIVTLPVLKETIKSMMNVQELMT